MWTPSLLIKEECEKRNIPFSVLDKKSAENIRINAYTKYRRDHPTSTLFYENFKDYESTKLKKKWTLIKQKKIEDKIYVFFDRDSDMNFIVFNHINDFIVESHPNATSIVPYLGHHFLLASI